MVVGASDCHGQGYRLRQEFSGTPRYADEFMDPPETTIARLGPRD